jgi:hypothetical protein
LILSIMARTVACITRGQGLHTRLNAVLHLSYSDAAEFSILRQWLHVDRTLLPMLMREHQTYMIRNILKPNLWGAQHNGQIVLVKKVRL